MIISCCREDDILTLAVIYSRDWELWNAWQLVFLEFNSPTQKYCKYQTPQGPDKHFVGHPSAAQSNDMFMHVIISVNCKIDTDWLYFIALNSLISMLGNDSLLTAILTGSMILSYT